MPNLVIAKIGAGGAVCLFNGGATHLIVDVAGYFPGTDALTPLSAPARLLDTRADGVTIDGWSRAPASDPLARSRRCRSPAERPCPAERASVVLNVTVDQPQTAGFITVYACDAPLPTASNVNYVGGPDDPELGRRQAQRGRHRVPVHVGHDTSGRRHHRLLPEHDVFVPLTAPARLLDSRRMASPSTVSSRAIGLRPNGGTLQLNVTGRAGIPASASAVVLNVTVDQPAVAGFITVYPAGVDRPNASNLNYVAGTDRAQRGHRPARCWRHACACSTAAPTHLIVDVAGYLTGPHRHRRRPAARWHSRRRRSARSRRRTPTGPAT